MTRKYLLYFILFIAVCALYASSIYLNGYFKPSFQEKILKDNWKLVSPENKEATGQDHKAAYTFDGDLLTRWRPKNNSQQSSRPGEVVIDLGRRYYVSGFSCFSWPYRDKGTGDDFEIFLSDKAGQFKKPVVPRMSSRLIYNDIIKEVKIEFQPIRARFVKFNTLSGRNSNFRTTIAEFNIYKNASQAPSNESPLIELKLASSFDNSLELQQVRAFLKDKRIAIVGPAQSYEGSGYGKEIDAHDIVCRVNMTYFPDQGFQKDYGSRGDILVAVLNETNREVLALTTEYWKDYRWVISVQNRTEGFRNININSIPLYVLPRAWVMNLKLFLNQPNTGIAAIVFLLENDIKELNIYGFDFYKSGYNKYVTGFLRKHDLFGGSGKDSMNVIKKFHNQDLHFKFFQQHILSDKRVSWVRPRKAIANTNNGAPQ